MNGIQAGMWEMWPEQCLGLISLGSFCLFCHSLLQVCCTAIIKNIFDENITSVINTVLVNYN